MPRYDEFVLDYNHPNNGLGDRRGVSVGAPAGRVDALPDTELAVHHAARAAVGASSSAAIGDQQENSRGATRRWKTEVAGLPCAIELADDRYWVVTIASATTTRRPDLAAAIVEASGGLVDNAEAFKLAAAVKNASDTRHGYGEQPTDKPQRQTRAGR